MILIGALNTVKKPWTWGYAGGKDRLLHDKQAVMKNSGLKSIAVVSPCILSQCTGKEAINRGKDRPNILIAMADDISYSHMGAYGCTFLKTPGFDRVAREGILFNNAYTPNAKSSPSRACLLTGRNSWQLEEGYNHIPYFPAKFTTFMESLKSHGYSVGHTAKGWAPGITLDSAGIAREMTGKAFNEKN